MEIEEIERVTNDKPKNSKRHEFGKKLSKTNKLQEIKTEIIKHDNKFNVIKVVGGLVAIVFGVVYYFKKKSISSEIAKPKNIEKNKVENSENKNLKFPDF